MSKVFVYVRNQKLKLSIIRILAVNDIPFIDASDLEEALFKLEFVKDISLVIQEFQDRENALKIAGFMYESELDGRVPTVWIIPDDRKDLVRLAAKWKINDLMTLPLNEAIFLRKVKSLLEHYDEAEKLDSKPIIQPGLLSCCSQLLTDAMNAASGNYPLCIISLQVNNLQGKENQALLGVLKSMLRRSDSIMDMDNGQYLILLPYTPKNSLPVVETKVRNAAGSVLKGRSSSCVHIYGVCFPEDAATYDELKYSLTRGIEQSIEISRRSEIIDSYFQRKLSRYQESGQSRVAGQAAAANRKSSRVLF